MDGTPAFIVSKDELRDLLEETSRKAATLAINTLKAELLQDPRDKRLIELRTYITNPTANPNLTTHWADSKLIRAIEPNPSGKPKSLSWFMQFKQVSGLNQCTSRPSSLHGRMREWQFRDIALAWEVYYALKTK